MSKRERIEEFFVADGHLIRNVLPARGMPYLHRCSAASLERIAHSIDETGDDGFTLVSLAEREDLPSSQVATALAFLKERGLIDIRRRRNYAASSSVHLDAMTEFHALSEQD